MRTRQRMRYYRARTLCGEHGKQLVSQLRRDMSWAQHTHTPVVLPTSFNDEHLSTPCCHTSMTRSDTQSSLRYTKLE